MTGGAIGGGVVIRTDDATAPRIASSRSLLAMTVLLGLSELGTKARRDPDLSLRAPAKQSSGSFPKRGPNRVSLRLCGSFAQ
jgi:hypothetical protein